MTKKKRTLSPEHLAKLQAGRAQAQASKQANQQANQTTSQNTVPATSQAEDTVTISKEQFDTLMQRLSAVEDSKTQTQTVMPAAVAPGLDQFGRPTGIISKYPVDPSYYNDPRKRLYDLPELERFAFKQNYILDFEVDQMIYETKFGTSMSEPKFTLTLKQRRYDEEGKLRDGLIILGQGIFFEDQAASIKEASAMGLPIDNSHSREFLDQMRFLRMRDWLVERLNPRRPVSTKKKLKEEVIGGKVYRIEEGNYQI
jgi:hypothetical protein